MPDRTLLGCLAAAAIIGAGTPAAADGGATDNTSKTRQTSSLAWVRSEGAETCIGGKELAEAVERVLGRRVFVSASAAGVEVEGRVDKAGAGEGEGRGWRATLRVSDDHGALLGSRELSSEAADCRAMDPSLAFVIAVMIDPDAADKPQAPLEPAASAAEPRPPQPEPPQEHPPAATRSRWGITPEVGIMIVSGELPSLAWGPTARVRVGPPALGIEIAGALFLPESESVAGAPSAVAQFTWAFAGAAVCPRVAEVSTVSFAGCAGASVGFLAASPGSGLRGAQASTDVAGLGDARARAEWRVTRALSLVADVGVVVPFDRPTWTATAGGVQQTVFRPSPVSFEGALAAGLTFE